MTATTLTPSTAANAANRIRLANFYYMGYNLPEGIAIERSAESGFTRGLIDYRAMAIADTKPIVPEAFVKLALGS